MNEHRGTFVLSAKSREVAKRSAVRLRRSRKLPAVVYGHGFTPRALALETGPFAKVLSAAGTTTLVDLSVDGAAPVKVLIAAVQYDHRTSTPAHADLHQVRMTEKVTAEIPLVVTGESPAVKELGGILVKTLDRVRVEGLPGNLVPEIAVDISALRTIQDRIAVKDLTVPEGLTLLEGADEIVVLIEAPRSEEELAALETKVEEKVEEVGVVEKLKKDEEEVEAEGVPEASKKPEPGKKEPSKNS